MKKRKIRPAVKGFLCLLLVLALSFGAAKGVRWWQGVRVFTATDREGALTYLREIPIPDFVDQQFLHVHNTARTGANVEKINDIVIHYVGNPGSSAQNNRDYFDKETTTVSSHFVVGLEGEIIQCLPLWERSAASNHRNRDTVSIEVCHPDTTGQFNETTYAALVKLTAFLCENLSLDSDHVIRHYDVTGKRCPLYYVEHEEAWETFKTDVQTAIQNKS
ncbi:MAG: N-acetylmuramoyl-L-alanine amidase [Clostridia bacterium]|nr:N-acetylmuramoyl-L-alanine amidase [Clostridia bacterium]